MILHPNKQKTNKHLFHTEMNFYTCTWCNHNWMNDKHHYATSILYLIEYIWFFCWRNNHTCIVDFLTSQTTQSFFSFFNVTFWVIGFALIIFSFLLRFLLPFTRGVGGFRSGTTGQARHKTRRHFKFSIIWNRKNIKWHRTAISPNHTSFQFWFVMHLFYLEEWKCILWNFL